MTPATREAQPYQTSVDYPNSPLAHALRPIAQAIKLDLGLRVATADFGGWDTHVGQARDFAGLVDGLGTSLTAFWDDLGQHKDHVQVVLMSEFGRRLRSNSGGGTDHGFGNAMLVLGQGISGGAMYGRWPGLRNEALDAGADLAITTDYRAVLSEIMSAHMAFADNAALFPDFTPQPVGLSRV